MDEEADQVISYDEKRKQVTMFRDGESKTVGYGQDRGQAEIDKFFPNED